MYGKERQKRKQLRMRESVLKCAEDLCDEQNRTFNNLVETLILKECERSKTAQAKEGA